MESLTLIARVFWFFLPAGVANMAPVLFTWVPFGASPIDLGATLNGKPLFGPHKTYRGFVAGVIAAIAFAFLQRTLEARFVTIQAIDDGSLHPAFLGAVLGAGALFGDLFKSFVKRRAGIESGKPWVPWDQIDWIAGAIIFTHPFVKLGIAHIVIALVLFGLLHPIVNLIGYALKIKSNAF